MPEPVTIVFPPRALVVLCGTSGSGKSTFARRHFPPGEIVASDVIREMVTGDAGSQAANDDVFALFHLWIEARLKHGRFTVADSTALKPEARNRLVEIAQRQHAPVFVVAFDVPVDEARRRDAARPDRQVGERVILRHRAQLDEALRELSRDARLAGLTVLTPETMDTATVTRRLPPSDGSRFDVIGDVHGCLDELGELLDALGYTEDASDGLPTHPEGRLPVFVGDLADRGPDSPGVLSLVCKLIGSGKALFVPGNHDAKLFRMLRGGSVQRTHGLDLTEAQLAALPEAAREALTQAVLTLLEPLPCHAILDGGRLVVAHAGIREEMIGRRDDAVVRFTRFGDVRGIDPEGMPIRHDWAAEYAGEAFIAYGHTPQETVTIRGNTVNLDGGCVFGGSLHALRWPERELVAVPARRAYAPRTGATPPGP